MGRLYIVIINAFGSFKYELPDHFKGNKTVITDPTEISNKFNEYFINVAPNLASKIPVSDMKFFELSGSKIY